MTRPPRLPVWLLVVLTAALCAGGLLLEAAGPFPLWRLAVQWTPGAVPSASAAPAGDVLSGVPVVSLVLDDADLYDPHRGLLANKTGHGPDWERPASLSYFEGGRLLFASSVGVRIHGGSSRDRDLKQAFRVYFRRRYGATQFAPGILFSPSAQPIRRLVIHNDIRLWDRGEWGAFVNPFAYDIAREMGALAPETRPARFYVNGEDYGVFVLTERFDERYFAAHWGHDEVRVDQADFDALWASVQELAQAGTITMRAIEADVDVESLTRWFLAVAFCATHDAYQSPGQFLDLTRASRRWFWVNWDMDGSFRWWDDDSFRLLLEPIEERRRGRNRAEPRAVLLTSLLADDPEYRAYFRRVLMHVMNHRVTQEFLEERYGHYVDVGSRLRSEHFDYLPRLREFVDRRRDFFWTMAEQWLNEPPGQPVTVTAPDDVALLADGEPVRDGYTGRYFRDVDVVLAVPPEFRRRFSGWAVDGRVVSREPVLTLRAERPTRVAALFDRGAQEFASAAAPVPSPATASSAAATREEPGVPADAASGRGAAALRLDWRPVPAGTFWMGCVPEDSRCDPQEFPRHQVTIDTPYEMLEREVSAQEFQAFADAAGVLMPRQPVWYAPRTHPVVNVTWDEAQAFCAWAGGRLPTEAEWERAARGGVEGRLFPWGDVYLGEANARPRMGDDRWPFSAPAGTLRPHGYGLRHMAGNVWEWTADRYRPGYDRDPEPGPDRRTIRGGSWDSTPPQLRSSARVGLTRHGRHNHYVGFRCVRPARSA